MPRHQITFFCGYAISDSSQLHSAACDASSAPTAQTADCRKELTDTEISKQKLALMRSPMQHCCTTAQQKVSRAADATKGLRRVSPVGT